MTCASRWQCGATLFLGLVSCGAAIGQSLSLDLPPGSELVAADPGRVGGFELATGPWLNGSVPRQTVDGVVQTQTWLVPDAAETGALTARLLHGLQVEGFTAEFRCTATTCGGFDFRHALSVGDAPTMHVDLGAFEYLTASADTAEGPAHVALMVSRGGGNGYVHLTLVGQSEGASVTPSTRALPSVEIAQSTGDVAQDLMSVGRATLDDLIFQTGASNLSGQRYLSLVALASFLSGDPARRVVLVGHTDAQGALDGNIALSQARADATRRYLIETLGVAGDQVEAAGIGYLAPRATNATPEGRQANRRVEVVLVSGGAQ